MCDHDQFTKLFRSTGGQVSNGLQVTSLPEMGGGIGVTAKWPLEPGHTTVSVPEHHFLLASRCRMDFKLPSDTPDIVSICIYLMSARLYCIHAELDATRTSTPGDGSPWPSSSYPEAFAGMSLSHFATRSPYNESGRRVCGSASPLSVPSLGSMFGSWIARLPGQYDNLLGIHPHEVLRGAGVEIEASVIEKWMEHMALFVTDPVAYVLPMIGSLRYARGVAHEIRYWRRMARQYCHLFPALPTSVARALRVRRRQLPEELKKAVGTRSLLIELFGWAYSSLMSRGFRHHQELWMMVPWVDYFNFSCSPNVRWKYSAKERAYQYRVVDRVGTGKELFIRYGEYSDIELLLWYGFSLCQPGSEPHSWKHQKLCQYIFSPLSDGQGDHKGWKDWLLTLLQGSGVLLDVSQGEKLVQRLFGRQDDMDFAIVQRVGLCSLRADGSLSSGLRRLIQMVASDLRVSPVVVLLQFLVHELRHYWKSQSFCYLNQVREVDELRATLIDSLPSDPLASASALAAEGSSLFGSDDEPIPPGFSLKRNCQVVREDMVSLLLRVAVLPLSDLEELFRT